MKKINNENSKKNNRTRRISWLVLCLQCLFVFLTASVYEIRPSGTPVVTSSALHEVSVQETLLDGSYGDIRNSLLPSPPMVSFGSLIGLLPYGSLVARWKFLAFEPWLRKKGLDPSKFRQGSGPLRIYQAPVVITSSEARKNSEDQITEDMEVEDFRRVYEQEKIQFVSSFIGQLEDCFDLSARRQASSPVVNEQ
ncbi:hypothetical protein AKJ16_DCAP25717 [Drosera capensis]